MKLEIGEQRPEHFKTYWPGQYEVFSHFEYACGIPSVLFAITTLKANGKPNVCFNGWSSFAGSGDGYYVIMPGMSHKGHTYQNILRTGAFVVNFLGKDYFDACAATIEQNAEETDEVKAGGFTQEPAARVDCLRLQEAFLCLECRFEREIRLSESAPSSLLIGRVVHVAAQEAYAKGIDAKYGEDGFMFNIHAPKNLKTGEGKPSAVAVCKIVRVNEEG